ncbi:MAG: deoxyribodipyrimidine photo-lyase [Chitinophagaceae bacterium]|jgi:deoxyribodipyrimidine photo-lyase|nr:deoxyribodipyrimidine photo-lyase [Chitinophagaceae bacterium]
MVTNEKLTVSIFWFRRDLRVYDNTGLYHALKSGSPVLPVFIFDTCILEKLSDRIDKRVSFIHSTLEQLKQVLEENNSSLYVLHGTPESAFEKICNKFDVKKVFTNHDYEPYAIERDEKIRSFLSNKNIPFHTFKDQVIYERSEIMKLDGSPYTVFTPYSKAWKNKYFNESSNVCASEECLENLVNIAPIPFPHISEIGFEKAVLELPSLNIHKESLAQYNETRNYPAQSGTSFAGVHLRFGTISIRHLAALGKNLNEQWLNELIWREFFMMILFNFPYVENQSFKKKYDLIQWRNNEKEFELWCKGKTGYPIVDAGMRQLNETGWMHNRVRMIVASFLTKHLLIDWRWGEAYFAEKLLDYELASNNGNWQWAAGSGCDAAPYFRIFNPSVQSKKFDPEMKYIKTWIRDFQPDTIIPMVDHDFARKRALEVYKRSLNDAPFI